jgi:hypothetical protein
MDDARWRAGAFATEIEHVSMTDLIFNLSAYRTGTWYSERRLPVHGGTHSRLKNVQAGMTEISKNKNSRSSVRLAAMKRNMAPSKCHVITVDTIATPHRWGVLLD